MGYLTVRGIASLKRPGTRHADGNNLYLRVGPNGKQSWTFMWSRAGKVRECGLGPYPLVGLAEARESAIDCHRMLRQGLDPGVESRRASEAKTFGDVADEFIVERVAKFKNARHRRQWERSLTHFARSMRAVPIADIGVDDVLKVLRPVWTSRPPTAKKLRIHIAKVLDYARAHKWRAGPNPAAWTGNLADILPAPKHTEEHWPSLPYAQVPALVAQLRQRKALAALLCEYVILTACRSTEAREMTFAEIDIDERVWTIPRERSKTDKAHRVPLCQRALRILDEVRSLGDGFPDSLCFPSRKGRPLSDQAVSRLLARMGVENGTVCLHGFRSSFSTWAAEQTTYAHEVVEQALAHEVGTKVSRAYRRTDSLDKRRKLMRQWERFCTARVSEVFVEKVAFGAS